MCVYVMCGLCVCYMWGACVRDRSLGEENLGLNPVLLDSHFRRPKILTTRWTKVTRCSEPIQTTVHLSLLPNL